MHSTYVILQNFCLFDPNKMIRKSTAGMDTEVQSPYNWKMYIVHTYLQMYVPYTFHKVTTQAKSL